MKYYAKHPNIWAIHFLNLRCLTLEGFSTGLSKSRNPLIMRIFHDLHYVEHNGVGNPYILKNYGRSVFNFSKSALRITLKFDKCLEDIGKSKEKSKEKIIGLIMENPKITIVELSESTGLSIAGIEKNFACLKQMG